MQRPVPGPKKEKQEEEKYAINEAITAKEVRLIGDEGKQFGILKVSEALRIAEDAGMDLVQVAADADPPVCRILDYGKLKYREQKKAAEARKKAATQDTKEIRIRYSTDSHDLETKIRSARRFLEDGDKVKFQMRFKGREVVYESLGRSIFESVILKLQDIADVDERTPLLGRKMILGFAPKPNAKKAKSDKAEQKAADGEAKPAQRTPQASE